MDKKGDSIPQLRESICFTFLVAIRNSKRNRQFNLSNPGLFIKVLHKKLIKAFLKVSINLLSIQSRTRQ
jgi:hypothetical protein